MKVKLRKSNYKDNKVYSFGNILKEKGYSTSFFHGGESGVFYIDKFSKIAGFESYFSKDNYMKENQTQDSDIQHWGITDSKFFNYFLEKLNKQKQPFLSAIFSLSAHHPFYVPEEYQKYCRSFTNDYLKSVCYSDKVLEIFFEKASKEPWFKNTLFVITADHVAYTPVMDERFSDVLGRYRTPLLFYFEGQLKPAIYDTVAQQLDIGPTIIDLLNIKPKKVNYLGSSLFVPNENRIAMTKSGEYYFGFSGSHYFRISTNFKELK